MIYKILIVDDEPEIRNLLRLYLENEGYEIIEASDGNEALRIAGEEKISLCILDIMMPGIDGFHVLQRIREDSNIPVMIISARDTDADKILGLNLGADDYLAKPFNPLEAVARVKSSIRRYYSLGSDSSEEKEKPVKVRDLELYPDSCTLKKGNTEIELTSVEYRIMEMFMKNPGKVFTKQQIYEYGWGEDYIIADNNIMVCISKLRSKLSEDPQAYIRTLRGLGYRLIKDV
ncbi:MAG: response regulator transcription factor [Lachnospiraceae bacterium]|nr:response regulator transcription factor [Lachnospiraceae bacterium]